MQLLTDKILRVAGFGFQFQFVGADDSLLRALFADHLPEISRNGLQIQIDGAD